MMRPEIDDEGRCVRHPFVQLRLRSLRSGLWAALLDSCPLCSADGEDSGVGDGRGERVRERRTTEDDGIYVCEDRGDGDAGWLTEVPSLRSAKAKSRSERLRKLGEMAAAIAGVEIDAPETPIEEKTVELPELPRSNVLVPFAPPMAKSRSERLRKLGEMAAAMAAASALNDEGGASKKYIKKKTSKKRLTVDVGSSEKTVKKKTVKKRLTVEPLPAKPLSGKNPCRIDPKTPEEEAEEEQRQRRKMCDDLERMFPQIKFHHEPQTEKDDERPQRKDEGDHRLQQYQGLEQLWPQHSPQGTEEGKAREEDRAGDDSVGQSENVQSSQGRKENSRGRSRAPRRGKSGSHGDSGVKGASRRRRTEANTADEEEAAAKPPRRGKGDSRLKNSRHSVERRQQQRQRYPHLDQLWPQHSPEEMKEEKIRDEDHAKAAIVAISNAVETGRPEDNGDDCDPPEQHSLLPRHGSRKNKLFGGSWKALAMARQGKMSVAKVTPRRKTKVSDSAKDVLRKSAGSNCTASTVDSSDTLDFGPLRLRRRTTSDIHF